VRRDGLSRRRDGCWPIAKGTRGQSDLHTGKPDATTAPGFNGSMCFRSSGTTPA
jgi:hypothetical protein